MRNATDQHTTATDTTMPTASRPYGHRARRIGLVAAVAVAALAAGGCGPSRTTPDMTLRATPATTEPTATLAINIKPEAPSADSGGRFVGSFTMSILPLLSAVSPSVGGDGFAAPNAAGAISSEIKRTKVAKVVGSSGDADYILTGETESRSQIRMHFLGMGAIAYGLALIPPALNFPHKSQMAECEADIVLKRRDGTTLFDRSYDRSLSWWIGPWHGHHPEEEPTLLANSVCAPEIGMVVARDVAAAIERDQREQTAAAPITPKP